MLRGGAFEEQRVHERLGEVAAQLALADVELFGEQAGRSACGAVSFKPARGCSVIALLRPGHGHPETADQEGALGVAEWPFVWSVAVDVAVLGQLVIDRVECGDRARVVGGDGAAEGGQEQCRVKVGVVGGALPVSRSVECVRGGVRDDVVGE